MQKVIVVGQGYVGLPVAVRAAEAGFDCRRVRRRARRRSVGSRPGTRSSRTSRMSPRGGARNRAIPPVGRPRRHRGLRRRGHLGADAAAPRASPTSATSSPPPPHSAPYARPGCTVVLESTTYPGTTEELVGPLLEEASGLTAGRDFHLGYSPERIDPGNPSGRFENTPKVVSGVDAGLAGDGAGLLRPPRRQDRAGVVPQGGRAGQAAGEHLPAREHRPGQRAGHVRRRPGHRRVGGHRRRRHQAVRLHAVHPWSRRRRPLPAHRPVVPLVAGPPVAGPHLPLRRAGQRRQRPHARLRRPAGCRSAQPSQPARAGPAGADARARLQEEHGRRPGGAVAPRSPSSSLLSAPTCGRSTRTSIRPRPPMGWSSSLSRRRRSTPPTWSCWWSITTPSTGIC